MIRKAIRENSTDRDLLAQIVAPVEFGEVTELAGIPDRITFETTSLGGVGVCVSMIKLKNASGGAFVILPPQASFTGTWDGLARATEGLKTQREIDVQMRGGGTLRLQLKYIK